MTFLPSVHGFRFANDFPHEPLWSVSLPFVGTVNLGDAWVGLCGGLTFACLDYYLAGVLPPALDEPPAPGSRLYRYLVRRAVDSLSLPAGVLRVLWWRAGAFDVRQRTWRQEVPRIVRRLEAGPVPLTLVRGGPVEDDHQVLAYACERRPGVVRLRVADPNYARDDGQWLDCRPVRITAADGEPVVGLYRTGGYWWCMPPAVGED